MSLPSAGWLADPDDSSLLRWWDGSRWSQMSVSLSEAGVGAAASLGASPADLDTPPAPTATAPNAGSATAWRPTALFWIIGSLVMLAALIGLGSGFGGFLTVISIACLVTGIVAIAAKRRTWLNIPASSRARGLVVAGSAALLILGAVIAPHGASTESASDTRSSAPASGETHDPRPSRTPTPTPTPTPVIAQLTDYSTSAVSSAQAALQAAGIAVTLQTADGQPAPNDWTGWTVSRQSPAAGMPLYAGSTVVLYLAPPPVAAPVPLVQAPAAPPAPVDHGGATAQCNDGTLSYSAHRQGTCSHHGGVAVWF